MMASFVQTGCSFTEAWGESMTFFQRALRYIQRKKSKSILLFSCFLMISTLVLCSVMVLQTAQATEQSIREKTGSKLVLENIQGNNGITSDTVTQAMELPSVTKINRISSGLAYPYDFSPVIIRDGTDAINLAVTLHAYDSTEIDGPFAQEKYRLLDGQHIGETQSGILVNSILADANQLGIGDRITLATETGESVSGEIIGIFFSGIERKQDDSIASAYRVENQIFVSHDLFSVLYGTEGYSTVAIYTDNPDTLEDLWEQIELLINDSISITSSDTLYRQMQAPLEQVIRITTLMLALIVITAVIVISLLLCMWTRTRTKEMADAVHDREHRSLCPFCNRCIRNQQSVCQKPYGQYILVRRFCKCAKRPSGGTAFDDAAYDRQYDRPGRSWYLHFPNPAGKPQGYTF